MSFIYKNHPIIVIFYFHKTIFKIIYFIFLISKEYNIFSFFLIHYLGGEEEKKAI